MAGNIEGQSFNFAKTLPADARASLETVDFPVAGGCTVLFQTGNCLEHPDGEWLQIESPETGEVSYAHRNHLVPAR